MGFGGVFNIKGGGTMFRRGGGNQSPSTLLDGLVASYSLDGNSNDDLNTFNGTDTNMSYTAPAGKINEGAAYDGTTRYFQIGGLSDFSFIQNTLEFSIAFWIKPTDYTSTFYIMGNTPTSTEKGFYLGWEHTTSRFEVNIYRGVNSSPTAGFYAENFFTNNDRILVVVTGNGSLVKTYKNAVNFAGFGGYNGLSSGDSTRNLLIGNVNFSSIVFPMNGSIDILGFWNRELLQEEIDEFYNATAGKQYPFFFNALGYKMIPLNTNISGMTPTDSSIVVDLGNGNLGMFFGWEGISTYATNWWKSTDGGYTWVQQGVLPFPSAHNVYGLREDGLIWICGYITDGVDIGDFFVCTFDPDLETFDTIAQITPPVGEDAQCGFFYDNELYYAIYKGVDDVDLYRWNDGTSDLVKHCDLPAENFYRSSAYVNGTTIKLTGGGLFDGMSETVDLVENVYVSTDGGLTFTVDYALPEPMQSLWPSLVTLSGRDIYIQGFRSQPRDDGHIYIRNGSTWDEIDEWTWLDGTHAVATCNFNGGIICMNGYLTNKAFRIERL